jgi:hypothetical protein
VWQALLAFVGPTLRLDESVGRTAREGFGRYVPRVLVVPRPRHALSGARFVLLLGSAALVAAVVRGAWDHPLALGIAVLTMAIALGLRWWAQDRVVRALKAGDVETVLDHWSSLGPKLPDAATTLPIMRATALAAVGRLAGAREALASAERGAAWEAALEHRLLVDVLLAVFDGDVDEGQAVAARLHRFPLPENDATRSKLSTLRDAMTTLARVFAHRSAAGDAERLERAADESPLVHWAMRYGAAIAAIDAGDHAHARRLVATAPAWPAESAFARFHAEISAIVGRGPEPL